MEKEIVIKEENLDAVDAVLIASFFFKERPKFIAGFDPASKNKDRSIIVPVKAQALKERKETPYIPELWY